MKKDDLELVQKARQGDQQAYNKLILMYKDIVYNIVFRMVRNKQEAEDLTQDAFVKAYKSIASFNDDYAFSTWLFKIATNNCIDFFRKRKLKTYSMHESSYYKDDEVQHEYADSEPTIEHELVASERSKIIRKAINNLPEKYRIVINLRHLKEYSYDQIAEELDLPLGTIKARIFRAREMLNKALRGKLF